MSDYVIDVKSMDLTIRAPNAAEAIMMYEELTGERLQHELHDFEE